VSKAKPKRSLALPLVALSIFLPVLAACGGSDDPSAGSSAAASGGKDNNQYVKFAQCMRQNGVPQWPDPVDGDKFRMPTRTSVDPKSPQFKNAMQKCRPLAPPGWGGLRQDPASQARMLKFSQCMRKNGVPRFPDPQGGALPSFGKDVNPDSPQFKNAQKACQDLAPGGVGG
jgi:hypothetical protein